MWQTLQVFKNKRFPLLNCSGVKVTVFVAFKGIVRTASSNSTAQEKELKLEKTKQDKILLQKQQGIYKTKSEKEKEKKNLARLEDLKKTCLCISDSGLINNSIMYNQKIMITDVNDEELIFRIRLNTKNKTKPASLDEEDHIYMVKVVLS